MNGAWELRRHLAAAHHVDLRGLAYAELVAIHTQEHLAVQNHASRGGGVRRLELDTAAYRRLPFDVRQEFDAWLKREGIEGAFHLKLGEGVVTVGRYLRNAGGNRYIGNRDAPRDQWVAAREYVEIQVESLPPAEAFR